MWDTFSHAYLDILFGDLSPCVFCDHFLSEWFTFLQLSFDRSLHTGDTSPLSDNRSANTFSRYVPCFFIHLMWAFREQKFLIRMRSNLSIFWLQYISLQSLPLVFFF